VPLNGYNQSVNLACDTSTLAVPCTFTPGAIVQLVPGQTVIVTASFAVPTTAQLATLPITLSATGGTANALKRTQTTNVQVTPASDFSFSGTQTITTNPGGNATLNYTLTPQNGFSGAVTLTCDTTGFGQPAPACTFSPSGTVQLTATQPATVTVSFTLPSTQTVGTYNVVLTAKSGSLTHTQTTSVQVQDFTFSFGSSSVTVKAGATIAPIPLTVTSAGGFSGSIAWGVAGCPSEATCTVSPNPSTPSQAANLTITTRAPSVSSERTSPGKLAFWLGLPFGSFGLVLARRKKMIGLATLLMLLGFAACGGGGGGGSSQPPPVTDPGTPAGTYNIVVTGTAGTTTHSQTFMLTVQ